MVVEVVEGCWRLLRGVGNGWKWCAWLEDFVGVRVGTKWESCRGCHTPCSSKAMLPAAPGSCCLLQSRLLHEYLPTAPGPCPRCLLHCCHADATKGKQVQEIHLESTQFVGRGLPPLSASTAWVCTWTNRKTNTNHCLCGLWKATDLFRRSLLCWNSLNLSCAIFPAAQGGP